MVETHPDSTAVHNLGRHSSNLMPHDMFADSDLSLLCPVVLAFILILTARSQKHLTMVSVS